MDKAAQYLISKDNGKLQITYDEYIVLMENAEEAERIRNTMDKVLANLEGFLGGRAAATTVEQPKEIKEINTVDTTAAVEAEVINDTEETIHTEMTPEAKPDATEQPSPAKARDKNANIEIPPIKKEVEEHFNKFDESGRLLNVFRQYYTCLNDACGGTVRVTMKDGFCSLWNYDEWEEFAFVDIFEGDLRFSVDPRYTDSLSALSLCEVPRLLSSRRNLVCVQLGDLNSTMLNTLTKAFEEVGLTAS